MYKRQESDGYLIIDRNIEGYNRGDLVEVTLHRPIPKKVFENRMVSIGSHDIVLDILNDLFANCLLYTSIMDVILIFIQKMEKILQLLQKNLVLEDLFA